MDETRSDTATTRVSFVLRVLVIALALAAVCMTLGIDRSSVEAADVASQPTPSDADQHVADEVRAAFMRDDAVASVVDRVKIAARGGVVVLSGRVHTVRQRDLLIGDARAVRGVARVDSRLIAAGD